MEIHFSKTRVKYTVKGNSEVRIGYLMKDKDFTGGYKIIDAGKEYEVFSVNVCSSLEKI